MTHSVWTELSILRHAVNREYETLSQIKTRLDNMKSAIDKIILETELEDKK